MAYRFRFYPTPGQASELNRTLGCVRFVWNWALADRTRRYRTIGESVGYHQLSAELTVLKKTEADGRERDGLTGLCFSASSVRALAADKADLIRRYRASASEIVADDDE